jgi:hypothetical protein
MLFFSVLRSIEALNYKTVYIMIKSFYIVQLSQIGNIGAHEIKKIKDQPKEGFRTDGQAETHLRELLNSDKHPYNSWHNFSIMPMYSILK